MWLGNRFYATAHDVRAAFQIAAQHGHLEVCMWLTERYLTADDVRADNNAAFRGAAQHGHLEVCKWLTERCLTADDVCADNNAAFRIAAQHGHLDVCNWLTETHLMAQDECPQPAQLRAQPVQTPECPPPAAETQTLKCPPPVADVHPQPTQTPECPPPAAETQTPECPPPAADVHPQPTQTPECPPPAAETQTLKCPPPAAEVRPLPIQTPLFDNYTLFTTKPFKGFAGRFRQLVIQNVGPRKDEVKRFVEKLRDRMNECDFRLYSRPEAFFPSVPTGKNSYIILNDGVFDTSDLDQDDSVTWVWYALDDGQFATQAAYMRMSPALTATRAHRTVAGVRVRAAGEALMFFPCTFTDLMLRVGAMPPDVLIYWFAGDCAPMALVETGAPNCPWRVYTPALNKLLARSNTELLFGVGESTLMSPGVREVLAAVAVKTLGAPSVFPMYTYTRCPDNYNVPMGSVMADRDGSFRRYAWETTHASLYACSRPTLETAGL
jgi:hypothetical protein